MSVKVGRYAFVPPDEPTRDMILASTYLTAGDQVDLNFPSLTTYYPETEYLEAFVPINSRRSDAAITHQFPDLPPALVNDFNVLGLQDLYHDDINRDSLLSAYRSIHRLYLNDKLWEAPWKFYHHPQRKQLGLVYGLPLYDLPRGEHCLRFERGEIRSDTLRWNPLATLCFLR